MEPVGWPKLHLSAFVTVMLDGQDANASACHLGGSLTMANQKCSIDCTTAMNLGRSTGLVM
jgi:hypothetical protein